MNKELMEALEILEREKEISKDTLFEAIENSLITAYKNHFGKADNVKVEIDRETCDYYCYAEKEVAEEVEDPVMQISPEEAKEIDPAAKTGDIVRVEIRSKEFGRIATQNAKSVILQKIREEERSVIYNQYFEKEKDVVTGIVQRYMGKNISINLGKADAILNENEQVRTEHFRPTERIKVYILEVRNTPKGPRILVSRTHPELVKRLFESEVTEIKDGTVEIMSIAREAGSRTKIAVRSNNPNVDAVGACVGINGARVNSIVDELCGRVNQRVEESIGNDRDGLPVQELTGWQEARDLQYYQQYGAKEDAIRCLFDGREPDGRFHSSYSLENLPETTFLAYIEDPEAFTQAEAERYIKVNQEKLLLQFLKNEALLAEYRSLVQDTASPLHRMRDITEAVKACGGKTVNVTIQKDGTDLQDRSKCFDGTPKQL